MPISTKNAGSMTNSPWREIDGLRGLPEQREADGDEGVDPPGGQSGDEQLEDIGHRLPLDARPA